jgi:hypothetical protein
MELENSSKNMQVSYRREFYKPNIKKSALSVIDGASGGQPACLGKLKKCRKKKMNSNTNVMYIHVCHVLCKIVMMFTCTLVRSHPDSRRRWGET